MNEHHSWWLDLLECPLPDCTSGLRVRETSTPDDGATGLLECPGCGALFPVLAGVPILVRSPSDWLAAYRDPVLATLAENGFASPAAVRTVDDFAAVAGPMEPLRFGDDWVGSEWHIEPPPMPGQGSRLGPFAAFVSSAVGAVEARILEDLPSSSGVIVELGCGAGTLAESLAGICRKLIVADLSLRAVLRARDRARAVPGQRALVAGMVVDAEALPFGCRIADAVVANQLIDLLGDPLGFVPAAAGLLRPDGMLSLTTPDPELAADGLLVASLESAGLGIVSDEDGLPWIRPHSERHFQVYVVRLVSAAA